MKIIDLTNQRFGMLRVVHRAGISRDGSPMWLCLCDCGSSAMVRGNHLRNGSTRSCGCKQGSHPTRHGKSKSRTYRIWVHMLQRCINPNNTSYEYYGGRGIMVCDRWQLFDNFFSDMGDVPTGMSIDRINTNDHYCLANCRWANHTTQMNNKRTNRVLHYNAESHTVADWARKLNMSRPKLASRIRRGWPIDEALGFTPHRCHTIGR